MNKNHDFPGFKFFRGKPSKNGYHFGPYTHVINVRNEDAVKKVRELTGGVGAHYVLECSGAENAINDAASMIRRGGKIGLAAFPSKPVTVDIANLVRNNAYIFATR